jgi:hypothetical protein
MITATVPTYLGRERIPAGTILSTITDEDAYPVCCPRCIRPAPEDRTYRVMFVDDDGTAECHVCGLTIPNVLPALP